MAFSCIAQPGFVNNPVDLSGESGNYHHRNYTSKEYGQDFQNWAVLQDKNGVMVFGNGNGVMTYDGKSWTLIETPTQSVIRSMAMDKTGKIYVGEISPNCFCRESFEKGIVLEH